MNPNMLARATKAILLVVVGLVLFAVLLKAVGGGWQRYDRWQRHDRPAMMDGKGMDGERIPFSSEASVAGRETGMMKDARDGIASDPGASAPMMERSAVQPGTALVSDVAMEVSAEKREIKTGSLNLRVENAEWSAGEIGRTAGELGGGTLSSNLSDNGSGIKSGTVTVRVPADRFDEAMGRIKSIARAVLSESSDGQDVTSQYVDLEARLKNKRAEEEAFSALLSRQTNDVSDVLQVTREVARVRGEIEQLQAQMKYLESQTDFSTISAFLSEDPQIGKVDAWRPWQIVKDAVNVLIKNLQWLVGFLINLVIVVLPILLILFLVFGIVLWKLGRKAYERLRK
jgi:hypothetical protein